MKIRLHTFLIAVLILLVSIGVSSHALSASSKPVSDLSAEASPSSELPGDTVIQFPDPNFEAAVREIIGKPTGDITVNDVARITELDVFGFDIADLTGIEYFAALEELSCQENLLTELDIRQNTKLKGLACRMNYLTTLDISHNPALEDLGCEENQLTTLDVSHNPALEYLACDTNQMTALDVRNNPGME